MATLAAHLQIRRLKLSNTKRLRRPFILTTEKPNVSLMFTTMATYCHIVQSQRILGKAEQVAHFPSSPRGFAQKTLHPSRTAEATCGIRTECKCQDIAQISTKHLHSIIQQAFFKSSNSKCIRNFLINFEFYLLSFKKF